MSRHEKRYRSEEIAPNAWLNLARSNSFLWKCCLTITSIVDNMFSVINGKSLTSQRVQLSHPTDRLPRPVLSPSSGRSAPFDKKTFKCLDISHGNRKDKESLQAIERKHKKTTLVPFGEDLSQALCPKHISENHDTSKPLFALEPSFTWELSPPRGGLSGWSPRHCLLPCLTFFISDGDCERSHVDTYDIWHMTYDTEVSE